MDWNGYATGWARLHGGYDPRRAGPLVRGWLRMSYGVGRALNRIGFTPSAVTTLNLLFCLAVPAVVGWRPGVPVLVASGLVLLAAVADSADGAVAVISGRTSRIGYVYDSLADRIGESAWLAAFWIIGAPGPLVVTAAALSWLHEYTRARASIAGMRAIGAVTVGERPTRVLVALFGLAACGAAGLVSRELPAGAGTLVTAVWVLLSAIGLTQLFAAVSTELGR
ncbi:CDP-alcohol phosphatidyltransferase family protein [Rhizomonospora bruguierae]|uniref:CDP-alcohol phosphatidyltransferase family protein n=1 Tax=Rhizomonospora bruguierae TaxID=1581705 RepID=UPI001BCAAA97|nr:CDP-alcohol phosphatidyltransferase family protein [Micromonospora sp. NBRC 107566]